MNTTLDSWISGGSRRRVSGSRHELFVRQDGPIDGKPPKTALDGNAFQVTADRCK
jgi:hypothetical protein